MSSEGVTRRAATAVIIVCLCAICGTLLVVFVPTVRRVATFSAPAHAYRLGDVLEPPLTARDDAPVTLILVGRSSCGACARSSAFYRELLATAESRGAGTVVVIPSPGAAGDREYGTTLAGLRSQVAAVDFSRLPLRVLPTLVVTDRRGEILYLKEGAPTAFEQPSVLSGVMETLSVR